MRRTLLSTLLAAVAFLALPGAGAGEEPPQARPPAEKPVDPKAPVHYFASVELKDIEVEVVAVEAVLAQVKHGDQTAVVRQGDKLGKEAAELVEVRRLLAGACLVLKGPKGEPLERCAENSGEDSQVGDYPLSQEEVEKLRLKPVLRKEKP